MLLNGIEMQEFKELEPVIKKCLQEMQDANLTCLKAQTVVKFLLQIIQRDAMQKQL